MPRPRRPQLSTFVQAKRHWEKPLSEDSARLGFLGWHERGYIPHCDVPNVTQFVTFCLADAFPVRRCRQFEFIDQDRSSASEHRRKIEAWLDRGHGQCWLAVPEIASLVEQTLRERTGTDYGLRAWSIMPNHVHVVFEIWSLPLRKLMQRWKGRTALAAHRFLHRTGTFWKPEFFDSLLRNEARLKRAIRYVENNPVKAHLVRDARDWPWSSARLRDKFGHLPP